MSAYALTPLARADIFDIWSYIAEDSQAAADRVENAIYESCTLIARGPMRGHFRPTLHLFRFVSGPFRDIRITRLFTCLRQSPCRS
ncbi:MAG: type II toxin-antitoxin system RelE/ParE family toxin [Terracidiphilus sp.]